MKFKSLLLFFIASALMQGVSAVGLPEPSIAQVTTGTSAKPADSHSNCQQAAKAVVTIYAGAEIGSGSIVDKDGTILTALHVVQEAVKSPSTVKIYVKLANTQRYIGRAIANDPHHDLALVQISTKEALPIVPLASDRPQSGQKVCAIGSPSGQAGILSQGTFDHLMANGDLQSAVRLTYGNSGGPLLDAQGELVGVNKSIWVSDRGANTGISYATSASLAKDLLSKNHRTTAVTDAKLPIASARLPGVLTKQPTAPVPVPVPLPASDLAASQAQLPQPLQERVASNTGGRAVFGANFEEGSMTIQQVESNSPAALGGLQPGDRVLAINGTHLNGLQQLQTFLSHQPSTAVLTIARNQHVANVQVNF